MVDKIIIGHDELAHHLAWAAFRKYFSRGPQLWKNLNKLYFDHYRPESQFKDIHSDEFQARLFKCIRKDIERWVEWVKYIKKNFQQLSHIIEDQIPLITKQIGKGDSELGRKILVSRILKSNTPGFSKTLGRMLLPNAKFIYPENYREADDIFIRNILHNEDIIKDRMRSHKPFWFVDSGYTNFIHGGNKRFHRLTRNDIHHGENANVFPADRLIKFDSFPKSWRTGGNKILIIEPSSYVCQLYGIGREAWKKQIVEELAKHTNKEIVFREKTGTRKTRSSLYLDLLKDKDVYCVVHVNSNAGTEAIWAGVPVITLGKHVTQRVSRTKLEDVNDLYRGPLGEWLCYLSYCQFEFSELFNPRIKQIMRKYHNV